VCFGELAVFGKEISYVYSIAGNLIVYVLKERLDS